MLASPPSPSPSPPPPPSPPPLPPQRLPNMRHALNRSLVLRSDQRERGVAAVGDTSRLRVALRSGHPITFAALGASNTVRGGCHAWQGSAKCTNPAYSGRSEDGRTARGWLLQAFDALNATWPHQNHRLVNHAMMATGPKAVVPCLDTYVPEDADVVLIAFAEMCWPVNLAPRGSVPLSSPVATLFNTTYGSALHAIVRGVLARRQPPTVVLFNLFKWQDGHCDFYKGCD